MNSIKSNRIPSHLQGPLLLGEGWPPSLGWVQALSSSSVALPAGSLRGGYQ